MTRSLYIPVQTSDISVTWLNEVLSVHSDVGTIASATVETMGEGVGILGEVARVRLTYAKGDTGPATLVAKCQSKFETNVMVSQMMGFYLREINFYKQLAPTINLRVPRCYHADCSPSGAPFVLLLEEITGARMIDQIVGATLEDCERIVDIGSTLHAMFWEKPELYALDWLPPWNNDAYKGAGMLVETKMAGFSDTWDGRLPKDAMAWMPMLTERYPDFLDWWIGQGQVTLAHTDFRADNFLFGGSGGPDTVTTLDFQVMTRHVGAWDIANFLGMSVTPENRREWQDQLLHRYHAGLVMKGVTDYSFERCVRDYRYCALQCAWSQIAISDADPGNERGRKLLDTMITRSFQNASDNNSGEALDMK
jgi:hypothetical protein